MQYCSNMNTFKKHLCSIPVACMRASSACTTLVMIPQCCLGDFWELYGIASHSLHVKSSKNFCDIDIV